MQTQNVDEDLIVQVSDIHELETKALQLTVDDGIYYSNRVAMGPELTAEQKIGENKLKRKDIIKITEYEFQLSKYDQPILIILKYEKIKPIIGRSLAKKKTGYSKLPDTLDRRS